MTYAENAPRILTEIRENIRREGGLESAGESAINREISKVGMIVGT